MACACKHTETAKIMKEMPTDGNDMAQPTLLMGGQTGTNTLEHSQNLLELHHIHTLWPATAVLSIYSPESFHQKPVTTQMFITARIDKLSNCHLFIQWNITQWQEWSIYNCLICEWISPTVLTKKSQLKNPLYCMILLKENTNPGQIVPCC